MKNSTLGDQVPPGGISEQGFSEFLSRMHRLMSDNEKTTAIAQMRSAMTEFYASSGILSLGAVCMIYFQEYAEAERIVNRIEKKFIITAAETSFLKALVAAGQHRWALAHSLLVSDKKRVGYEFFLPMLGDDVRSYFENFARKILQWTPPSDSRLKKIRQKPKPEKPAASPIASPEEIDNPLRRITAALTRKVVFPDTKRLQQWLKLPVAQRADAFRAVLALNRVSLIADYEELLAASQLRGFTPFWYQLETVKKVLRQFHGRVLLADEVGLGKTIEAALTLKEYMLRGEAARILILTPATLVSQWQEELREKFGIECQSNQDEDYEKDQADFWNAKRLIVSIATARRDANVERIARFKYDLVIVDEAHHLKNRQSKNWKLVNALQTKYLLLLSATPVQNNLIELYNILTLLKPGIFKTEKDFRSRFVSEDDERRVSNRDALHSLMRDVMIRNTRSLVDVKLPPRHALTIRVPPIPDEAVAYEQLTGFLQSRWKTSPREKHRFAHLLAAAGSSVAAVRKALGERAGSDADFSGLAEMYRTLQTDSKETELLALLKRNSAAKKIVFVRFRETIKRLKAVLAGAGHKFAVFSGEESAAEKDEAVRMFREDASILLCSESGGEGRNLQFCNTVINYDLPWNPQAIEQRIGRVHRIGQENEVYIFNFARAGTLEDHMLKILDEKINMFELVVGEIQSIMGELSDDTAFADLVFSAWMEQTDASAPLGDVEKALTEAKGSYEKSRALDQEIFADALSLQ